MGRLSTGTAGGDAFTFPCKSQSSFRHGANMCTTACMQVGMAILCGRLELQYAHSAFLARDEQACFGISRMLNWCMDSASTVHGRVESMLEVRDRRRAFLEGGQLSGELHWQNAAGVAPSRMVSVNELTTLLGIDMAALNVSMHELFVCKEGISTRVSATTEPSTIGEDGSREKKSAALRYKPESCFISLSHLPACMLLKNPPPHLPIMSASSSVCIITANLHTLCAACYRHPHAASSPASRSSSSSNTSSHGCTYAVFDPMPGRLWIGLTGRQMVERVRDQLGIPSFVIPESIPPPFTASQSLQSPDDGQSAISGGMHSMKISESSASQCEQQQQQQSKRRKQKSSEARVRFKDEVVDSSGDGGGGGDITIIGRTISLDYDQECNFYCDVTLMHI